MIVLYIALILILIVVNEKFFEKKYEIFLYLIFGIFSPVLFFIPELEIFSVMKSNLVDKIFIITILAGSALLYLFNLINSEIKIVNNLKRNLLILFFIGFNSAEIKSLFLLILLFNFLMEINDRRVRFKIINLFSLIFIALSFTPYLKEAFWIMSLLTFLIVLRTIFSKLDLKEVILATFIVSNFNDLYSFSLSLELLFFIPCLIILIPFLVSEKEKDFLIDKMNNIKPLEKLSIGVLVKKDRYIEINKLDWKLKHFNRKRLSDQFTLYNSDYNLTYIFILVSFLISLFFGVVI